jgi:hypothetical protein
MPNKIKQRRKWGRPCKRETRLRYKYTCIGDKNKTRKSPTPSGPVYGLIE